jgi:hypothetical protein
MISAQRQLALEWWCRSRFHFGFGYRWRTRSITWSLGGVQFNSRWGVRLPLRAPHHASLTCPTSTRSRSSDALSSLRRSKIARIAALLLGPIGNPGGGGWVLLFGGPWTQMLAAKQTPYLGSFELQMDVVRLWSLARQVQTPTLGVHGQLSNLILVLTSL